MEYNLLCSWLRNLNSSFVRQIGRSTEGPIDFVVTDTVSGGGDGEDTPITQSTISRFACRVVCERNPPYTARIYAAGFDTSKNIFLGVSVFSCLVLKWNRHKFQEPLLSFRLYILVYVVSGEVSTSADPVELI